MKKTNIFSKLGIPKEASVPIFIFGFILSIAPIFGGVDFGIFTVPDFSERALTFSIIGIAVIIIWILANLPLIPPTPCEQLKAKGYEIRPSEFLERVKKGDTGMVGLFLKCKINPNEADLEGRSALLLALVQDNIELSRLLVKHGSHFRKDHDDNFFWEKVNSGNADLVEILIDAGAEVDMHDTEGNTILTIAAKIDDENLASLAIDRGINVNATTNKNCTALMIASENGNINTVQRILVAKPELDHQDNIGMTALLLAAQRGYTAVVVKLIDNGVNIDVTDTAGNTLLITAAKNGYEDIAFVAIEREIDVNATNKRKDTALMIASEEGNINIVKRLLATKSKLNLRDNHGMTALMRASVQEQSETVEELIGAGADLNMQADDGSSALILASKLGCAKMVELLIDSGANIQRDGATALDEAYKNRHFDVWKVLEAAGVGNDMPKETLDFKRKLLSLEACVSKIRLPRSSPKA